MTEPLIPGGYILLSRRLIESGIMQKPPIYFKIWTWLLLKAQHKDYGNLKRGQLITSIAEIQEAMSYKVGFRIEKPSRKQVWGVLEWLRNPEMENSSEILVNNIVNVTTKEPMIVTMKVTHGILVTIVKYNVYQDPKNYEGNDEGTMTVTMKERRRERQGNNINKNDKNGQECNKNDKEDIYIKSEPKIIFDYWNDKKIIQHRKMTDKIKRKINGALKHYKQEEICTAIDNYHIILTDIKYFWTHKWTLTEFLDRGIERFMDFEIAANNFAVNKKLKGGVAHDKYSEFYE